MAETYKLLGQAAPTIDTLTDLYTVPAGASAVAATLVVAHIGDANDPTATYRVSVAVAGAMDAAKQVILNDVQLAENVAAVHKLALTLGPGDVVRVRCREALCAFNLFGAEISPMATATVAAAILAGAPGGATVNPQVLKAWTASRAYQITAVTYNATYPSLMDSASVVWPDSSAGTLTVTQTNTTYLVETAYTITHNLSGKTVTQAAVTLDGNGHITAAPELTVA